MQTPVIKLTQNGIKGFTYWQDANLVHIENKWIPFGRMRAQDWEVKHRDFAFRAGDRDAWNMDRPLCPACYMLGAYNMLVALAQKTGQDLEELGRSMATLFTELAEGTPPDEAEARVFPYRNALKVYACEPTRCITDDSFNPFDADGCEEETG